MHNYAYAERVLQLKSICSGAERYILSYKIPLLVAIIKMCPEKKFLEWKKL